MDTLIQWVTNALYIFFLLGAGFWLGARWNQAKESVIIIQEQESTIQVEAQEVPGVHWIGVGNSPECPETHPIKGKLGSDAPVFYTKDNDWYDRIKPQLCFATEEYARDVAGFVKKF